MSEQPWLVTTFIFKGSQFLVKMNSNRGHSLELSIIDKHSGEEWSSKYDNKFIENLTLKTGNYKQFDIFITMLKSGLLRTSECVSLDLLTFEDLELLRGKKDKTGCKIDSSPSSRGSAIASANRRYLILTYTVEFDRIHYPLPVEYIGPPNPRILQATIRKLEAEVQELKKKLDDRKGSSFVEHRKDRVKHLEAENWMLQEEVAHLKQLLRKQTRLSVPTNPLSISSGSIPITLQSLEEQVKRERASFRATLQGLQEQNHRLRRELDEIHCLQKESLKTEPVSILWKRQGKSPTTYQMSAPPRRNENIDNKSHPISRNEVWRTRLNNANAVATKPNRVASDKRSRMGFSNKPTLEHHKKIFSDNDVRCRNISPSMEKPYPNNGNRPHAYRKARENHHMVSSGERTSSSECSSRCGRMPTRKPKYKHSRSSSQASSHSTSSSIASSSTSKKDKISRRNPHGDAGFINPPKISSSTPQRDQPLLPNCQPPHRKDHRKPSRRGTSRMSDLETRIKALQNMLNEGLSLP